MTPLFNRLIDFVLDPSSVAVNSFTSQDIQGVYAGAALTLMATLMANPAYVRDNSFLLDPSPVAGNSFTSLDI